VGSPDASAKRAEAVKKLVSALGVFIAAALALLLPPIANKQLAEAIATLRKPGVDVVVAIVFVVFVALSWRVVATLALVLILFGGVQLIYFYNTTSPGENASVEAASWVSVSTNAPETASVRADGAKCLYNEENNLGSASECWQDGRISIDLNDKVGTSQQGLYWQAGQSGVNYLLSARVESVQGSEAVSACPLFFGIKDEHDYFMFYVKKASDETYSAEVVHRQPLPDGRQGFTGQVFAAEGPLPYVKYWNLLRSWEGAAYELKIKAMGDRYYFYVNDRAVFEGGIDGRQLPADLPRITTIGVVAITNNEIDDVACNFSHVSLRHR
jgi:hypothetical protein